LAVTSDLERVVRAEVDGYEAEPDDARRVHGETDVARLVKILRNRGQGTEDRGLGLGRKLGAGDGGLGRGRLGRGRETVPGRRVRRVHGEANVSPLVEIFRAHGARDWVRGLGKVAGAASGAEYASCTW